MTTKWELLPTENILPKMHDPILLEGLPGIGNVGKIALDYIIEEVEAKKVFDICSNTFPHSVFITEENLIELPTISVYHKKIKGKDILFLAGDIQPTDEIASYDFSNFVLDFFKKTGGKRIITLGGIALNKIPKVPKVFCTGNDKAFIKEMIAGTSASNEIYGVVGPIVGVSGLLLGLATPRKMKAMTLLAETLGHPMYLGMDGAKEILKVLDKKHKLGIDISGFDREIKQMEDEMRKRTLEMGDVQKAVKKNRGKYTHSETSYIG